MSALQFAAPHWAGLLWAVLALTVLLWWLDGRGREALGRFVSAALQPRLVQRPSPARRRLRIACVALAASALVLALMRPQWGNTTVVTPRSGAEIMIALDVSRSMLAEDAVPNRLDRAKAEIRDLLGFLDGDQVGLIAFAGRATVLTPLTPDFDFVRLTLDNAVPGSTGRGGTRLEEPIRKAVDGFGATGNAARALLLITDGEDHDSFPLDAAEEAARLGIRILAVGFGDEAGAEIPITDPRTGARRSLRDSHGAVVRSRLDGELLRELARITDGAYIPAGTGVLDLASIYRRHIAPLTRGRLEGRERVVANEMFQWPLLVALLCLLFAVLATARPSRATAQLLLLAAALPGVPLTPPAQAQGAPAQALAPAETPSASAAQAEAAARALLPGNALEAYNKGVAALQGNDLESARRLFEHARSLAGENRDLRFNATFNRAWVSVRQADAQLRDEPEAALAALQEAGRWFADAVQQRAADGQARENLELVMRRALQLGDQLAVARSGELPERLDRLLAAQQTFMAELAGSVAAEAGGGPHTDPTRRREYRALSTEAITLLADTQAIATDAERAARGLQAQDNPEAALRQAGLSAAVEHLQGASERVMQSRARLRRAQGAGAYRRAAHALQSMRRARDQLRSPLQRLDALLADGRELRALTLLAARAAAPTGQGVAPATAAPDALPPRQGGAAPDWLDAQHLSDLQAETLARHGELRRALEAVADAAPHSPASGGTGPPAAAGGPAPPTETSQAEAQRLREQASAALPHVQRAGADFTEALQALRTESIRAAPGAQAAALQALALAREQFLDLRPLIELTYAEQRAIRAGLAALAEGARQTAATTPGEVAERDALAISLHRQQRANLQRGERVGALIEAGLTQAAKTPPEADAAGDEAQRLRSGQQLWQQAQAAMMAAERALDEAPTTGPRPPALAAVDASIEHLEALRRLFFTIIEHLRETTALQARVNQDSTEFATLHPSMPASDRDASAGPLGLRQTELGTRAADIASVLEEQGRAATPATGAGGAGAAGASVDGGPGADQILEAAGLVAQASTAMTGAGSAFGEQPLPLVELREAQDRALQQLTDALRILEPPPPEDDEQNQDSQGEQSDGESGQDEAEQQPDRSTMNQLLQAVRDREAARNKERAERARAVGGGPVEKDW